MYGFMQIFGYDDILYSLENDKLLISGDLKGGWIFEKYILTRGGQDIVVELDYEGEASNPVVLEIYNQQIDASYVDKNKIIWKFRGPERSENLYYKLFSLSEQDYKIVNFSITMSDR